MKKNILILLDVDGTLTQPMAKVSDEMINFLGELKQKVYIGIVGGSDLNKQIKQLGDNLIYMFDYIFSENGLVAYKNGILLGKESIQNYIGENNIKDFINFTLKAIADINIPIKKGTFIEFRNGMINISPIGRNCSQIERDEFEKYDSIHNIRLNLISLLKENFLHLDLVYNIGGQISFDVFPKGWDKTFCLKYLKDENFEEIHFIGDKTLPGGNDYELFIHPDIIGHCTVDEFNTVQIINNIIY